MKYTLYMCLFLICSTFHLDAQTATQTNAWYMYFGNHKLANKWGLHTEYQFRRSGLIADWQQSLARVGLDYYYNDNTSFTGGYGWIVSFPYGEQPILASFHEHRIWQQVITNQKIGRFGLNHRYRLEQRWLENFIKNPAGTNETDNYRYRNRFRYRFMLTIPISNRAMVDNTIFLAAYNEVFIGFGEGIGANVLDQNRLYFALGYRFDSSANIQLGYLNHRVFKSDGMSKEHNHTLQVALTKNFDFSKKNS